MDSRWESTSSGVVLPVSDCDSFFHRYASRLFASGVGVAGFTLGGGKLKINNEMRFKFSDSGLCRIFMAH